MSTHALRTSEGRAWLALLRNLDLILLAVALPVFAFGGLPMVGYAAVAGAWLLQWLIAKVALQRAVELRDRRAALRALVAGLVARLGFAVLAVLGAGLADKDAGVAAGVLALLLFTVHLSTSLVAPPLEDQR